MLRQWFVVGLVLCVVTFSLAEGEMRDWASADGSQKFSGAVLNVLGSKVELKNSSGRKVTVPISKLSKADQEYLAAYAKVAL